MVPETAIPISLLGMIPFLAVAQPSQNVIFQVVDFMANGFMIVCCICTMACIEMSGRWNGDRSSRIRALTLSFAAIAITLFVTRLGPWSSALASVLIAAVGMPVYRSAQRK